MVVSSTWEVHRMRRMCGALVLVLVLGFVVAGCERGQAPSGAGSAAPREAVFAKDIDDGAEKAMPDEWRDLVSGQQIKPEIYTDIDAGRLYFASEQSKEQYLKNPERYQSVIPPK